MEPVLNDIAHKVIDLVKRQGDAQAEVFLTDSQELTIEVAEQNVENMKLAGERGLGLRVIDQGRVGYAYTSDLGQQALRRVVQLALENTADIQPDGDWELAPVQEGYPCVDIYNETLFKIPVENKILLAQEIEAAARGYDPRVKITKKAVYTDAQHRVILVNSLGLHAQYRSSYCGAYALVVAKENGHSQTGFSLAYGGQFSDLVPTSLGREAGFKAVRMLGAGLTASAALPIVLEPYCAMGLLGVLQRAFSAEAVVKGRSFLAGLEGQKVASSCVTLVDDGTLDRRLGSAPFDAEGMATQRKALIREGLLEGWLHNTYTGRKMGLSSTGNATRSSYKGTIEVGTTNFYLEQGTLSLDELLGDIKKGLYVTDMMGVHMANPITGDFSLGVEGQLIENGRLTAPVKGLVLAGNLRQVLQDIEGLGCDLTFYANQAAPTVRLKPMAVSGV